MHISAEINRVSLIGTVINSYPTEEKRGQKFILVKTTAGNNQKE